MSEPPLPIALSIALAIWDVDALPAGISFAISPSIAAILLLVITALAIVLDNLVTFFSFYRGFFCLATILKCDSLARWFADSSVKYFFLETVD